MAARSKTSETEHHYKAFIVLQTVKLLNTLIAGGVQLGMVYLFMWGMIEVSKSQPSWLAALEAIVALYVARQADGPVDKIVQTLQNYMATDHQRLKAMEIQLDPSRETSGLKNTGESEHDRVA